MSPKTGDIFRGTVPCANILWRFLIIWCWTFFLLSFPFISFFCCDEINPTDLASIFPFVGFLQPHRNYSSRALCLQLFSHLFYLPPVSLGWCDHLKSREATQEARDAKAWIKSDDLAYVQWFPINFILQFWKAFFHIAWSRALVSIHLFWQEA